MNIWRIATKIFAFFSLIFLSFIAIYAQPDSIYRLPAGTKIVVQMDNEINSRVSGINDTFTATISEPVRVRDSVILPIGTVVEGRVLKVKRASAGGRNGNLSVSFETLRFADGEKRQIEGILVNELKGETSQTTNLLTIIGGTAIGGIVGAVSQSDNGLLIGAGLGAGAGTGIAFLKKGREVRIKADQMFEIELTKNVTLPVLDF